MSRTHAILSGKDHSPLVFIRYPPEQTAAPLLRYSIQTLTEAKKAVLLLSLLYPPSAFIDQLEIDACNTLHILDLTASVPGYLTASNDNICNVILSCISNRMYSSTTLAKQYTSSVTVPGVLTVIFDSVSTLTEDLDSISQVYQLLGKVLADLNARPCMFLFAGSRVTQRGSTQVRVLSSFTSTSDVLFCHTYKQPLSGHL
jgi:hypothetical protein